MTSYINSTWDSRTSAEIYNSENCHIYDPEIGPFAANPIQLKFNIIKQFILIMRSHFIGRSKKYNAILMQLCKPKKPIKSRTFQFGLKAYFANIESYKIDRPNHSGLEIRFIQDKPLFTLEELKSLSWLLHVNDDVDSISKTTTWANRDKWFRYMIQLYFWSESLRQIYQYSWSSKIAVPKIFKCISGN